MYIQIRKGMNYLPLDKGNVDPLEMKGTIWQIDDEDPDFDFRDDSTVWVWLRDDLCIEMDRDLIEGLLEGFEENKS